MSPPRSDPYMKAYARQVLRLRAIVVAIVGVTCVGSTIATIIHGATMASAATSLGGGGALVYLVHALFPPFRGLAGGESPDEISGQRRLSGG